MRKNLGERIKHYRELRGLTQKALGLALNADKGTIWRWEAGESWPEYPALQSLSDVLKIDIEELFENLGAPVKRDTSAEEALEIIRRAIAKKDSPVLSLVPDDIRNDVDKLVRLIAEHPEILGDVLTIATARAVGRPDKAKRRSVSSDSG